MINIYGILMVTLSVISMGVLAFSVFWIAKLIMEK